MSDIGINPTNDGKVIRLISYTYRGEGIEKNFPRMSRKGEEEAKIAIRNIRRDGNDNFKNFRRAMMFQKMRSEILKMVFRKSQISLLKL